MSVPPCSLVGMFTATLHRECEGHRKSKQFHVYHFVVREVYCMPGNVNLILLLYRWCPKSGTQLLDTIWQACNNSHDHVILNTGLVYLIIKKQHLVRHCSRTVVYKQSCDSTDSSAAQ